MRSIRILARRPEDASVIADAAVAVLGTFNLASVGVQTSERLAEIRSAVQGELCCYWRRFVTIVGYPESSDHAQATLIMTILTQPWPPDSTRHVCRIGNAPRRCCNGWPCGTT